MKGGDLVFCWSNRPASIFIRTVTWGDFSHVALVLDEHGTVAEATASGILVRNISDWPDSVRYTVVSIPLSEEDREDVLRQARNIVDGGWSYDWATFFGVGVFWLTGGRLMVSSGAKAAICSAFCADCHHAGGHYYPEKIPHFMLPKDMQRHYGVEKVG